MPTTHGRTLIAILLALVSLLSARSLVADSGGRDEVAADMILMQGKWKLVDFVYYRNGIARRPPRQQAQGTRTVTGNRYRLQLSVLQQRVDAEYTFTLFPDQQPKAFDVTLPDDRVIKGIYEIKGDTLRRCYTQPNDPRPQKFQSGNQTYQEWRRVVELPKQAES